MKRAQCQEPGHWAKGMQQKFFSAFHSFSADCPDETSNKRSRSFGTNTNNSAAIDAECYKCHKMGHFSNGLCR